MAALPNCDCPCCRYAVEFMATPVVPRSAAESLVLNRAYEDHRRRWRTENPIADVKALEEVFGRNGQDA